MRRKIPFRCVIGNDTPGNSSRNFFPCIPMHHFLILLIRNGNKILLAHLSHSTYVLLPAPAAPLLSTEKVKVCFPFSAFSFHVPFNQTQCKKCTTACECMPGCRYYILEQLLQLFFSWYLLLSHLLPVLISIELLSGDSCVPDHTNMNMPTNTPPFQSIVLL